MRERDGARSIEIAAVSLSLSQQRAIGQSEWQLVNVGSQKKSSVFVADEKPLVLWHDDDENRVLSMWISWGFFILEWREEVSRLILRPELLLSFTSVHRRRHPPVLPYTKKKKKNLHNGGCLQLPAVWNGSIPPFWSLWLQASRSDPRLKNLIRL